MLVACNRGKLDIWIPAVAEFMLEHVTVEELDKDAIFERITRIDVLKVYPWEVHKALLSKIMPRMWWVKDQVHQDLRSDSMSVTKLITEASTFLGMIEVLFQFICN